MGNLRVFEARLTIERIMVEKARESQKVEDFDAYLKKFKKNPPSKKTYEDMKMERKDALTSLLKASSLTGKTLLSSTVNPQKMYALQSNAWVVAKYLTNLKTPHRKDPDQLGW